MAQTPPYPALSLGAAHNINAGALNSGDRGPARDPRTPSINLQRHQLFLLPYFLSVEMKQQQMSREEHWRARSNSKGDPVKAMQLVAPLCRKSRSTWTPL